MLREHSGDLPEFLSTNPQGREIPGYLSVLVEQLSDPQKEILPELDLLRKGIDHIRDIVQLQLRYTGVGGVSEIVVVADLVEDAIRINVASFQRHDVQLIRHYLPVPAVPLEKSKVLQILVNLLSNGKHALEGSLKPDKILTVGINLLDRHTLRIVVADNGVGIPPENLARIFESGFTTRKGGHGFGLHSGATAATEMRGSLTAESDGVGQGAIFTLQLPFPFTEGIS